MVCLRAQLAQETGTEVKWVVARQQTSVPGAWMK